MSAQLPPALAHRCQRFENDVGELSHVPVFAVSVEPSRAVPEMVGAPVLLGAAAMLAEALAVAKAKASATTASTERRPGRLFRSIVMCRSFRRESIPNEFPPSRTPYAGGAGLTEFLQRRQAMPATARSSK